VAPDDESGVFVCQRSTIFSDACYYRQPTVPLCLCVQINFTQRHGGTVLNSENYMATILITGGTGMIGTRLTKLLIEKGYDVIILTRNTSEVKHRLPGVSYANWDIINKQLISDAIAKPIILSILPVQV
jgi:hypothetical protein